MTDSDLQEKEQRERILVVDDEAPIRELVYTYLSKQGYDVSTARTGAEALNLDSQQSFDLILLDLLLEDADGMELLSRFKKLKPSRPVVIITGWGTDEQIRRQAMENGASDCLSKSVPLPQLIAAIRQVMAAPRVNFETPKPAASAPASAPKTKPQTHFQPQQSPAPAAHHPTSGVASPKAKEFTRLAKLAKAAKGQEDSQAADQPSSGQASEKSAAPPAPPRERSDLFSLMDAIALVPEAQGLSFGMEMFAKMLSAYHANLANTAMRAVILCRQIGETLALPVGERQILLWAAAMHDISLVHVDRCVVNRWLRDPAKCSKQELALIKGHPEHSARLLELCPLFKDAGNVIRSHHEHWDGAGFPSALKQEMIPWLSRLLAVAIYYCCPHLPGEQTVTEIRARADKMFDPRAVEVVLQAIEKTTLPLGERELLTYELRTGMVLSRDVVNWDGLLIYGSETVLTDAIRQRLTHLSEHGSIDSRIRAYC